MIEAFHGLTGILNYWNGNHCSKNDQVINGHHYHITKHSIIKKHITFTNSIKPAHIILNIIDVPMHIVTINSKRLHILFQRADTNTISNNVHVLNT